MNVTKHESLNWFQCMHKFKTGRNETKNCAEEQIHSWHLTRVQKLLTSFIAYQVNKVETNILSDQRRVKFPTSHSKQIESKIWVDVGGRNDWKEKYLKKSHFLPWVWVLNHWL